MRRADLCSHKVDPNGDEVEVNTAQETWVPVQALDLALISPMTMSPFPLLVVVIDRAGARTYARADECAFPPAPMAVPMPIRFAAFFFPASGFR